MTLTFAIVAAGLLLAQTPPRPAAPGGGCNVDPDTLDFERDVVPPKKVKHVPPLYPPRARERGKGGTVVVELILDARGQPSRARVKAGIDRELDEAAITAVQQWEYTPSLIRGHPCPTVLDVSVNFVLSAPEPQPLGAEIDETDSPSFARDECGISLAMPSPRRHEWDRLSFPEGDIVIHQYRALVGDVTYGLVCASAPGLASGDYGEQLDLMRDNILKSNQATLLEERITTLSGQEGREMLAQSPTHMLRARLFVWPDRTLNISVFGDGEDVAGAAAEDFLNSAASVVDGAAQQSDEPDNAQGE